MKAVTTILTVVLSAYLLGYPMMLFGMRDKNHRHTSSQISLIAGGDAKKQLVSLYRPLLRLHSKVTGIPITIRPMTLS